MSPKKQSPNKKADSNDDNTSKISTRSRSRSPTAPSSRRGFLSRAFSYSNRSADGGLDDTNSVRSSPAKGGGGGANGGGVGRCKVSERLDKAVEMKAESPKNKNRSPDLVPLTKDYDVLKKNLRALVAATKAYQEAIEQMDKSRTEVSGICMCVV